jgi:hypothetical protein
MSMRMTSALIFLLGLLAVQAPISGKAAPKTSTCETSQNLAGTCFVVHGRLSIANGNPSFRIWPIGTKRMLGVLDGTGKGSPEDFDSLNLPPKVEERMSSHPDETYIFGDFTVCPFDEERPGWMRNVCIAHADHLVVRP